MFRDSIPVICYHRINENDSISPAIFEKHLQYLTRAGYNTLAETDVLDHFSGRKRLRGKHVVLTFDDGYQDFYHDAFPLLQKYNAQALVFLIGNHVVSAPDRKPADAPSDYSELHRRASDSDFGGFLSLEQIREIQSSGLVTFGGHTMTHSVSLVSPDITGLYTGERLKWYVGRELALQKGSPLFRISPNLLGPRFIPDPEFVRQVIHLAEHEKLPLPKIEELLGNTPRGVMEDAEDWQRRLEHEIRESKALLEAVLERPVKSFCWPWGLEGSEARGKILEAGYELLFTLSRGSNTRPEDAASLNRFSARRKGGAWLSSRLLVFNNTILASYYDRRYRRQPPSPFLSYY